MGTPHSPLSSAHLVPVGTANPIAQPSQLCSSGATRHSEPHCTALSALLLVPPGTVNPIVRAEAERSRCMSCLRSLSRRLQWRLQPTPPALALASLVQAKLPHPTSKASPGISFSLGLEPPFLQQPLIRVQD